MICLQRDVIKNLYYKEAINKLITDNQGRNNQEQILIMFTSIRRFSLRKRVKAVSTDCFYYIWELVKILSI